MLSAMQARKAVRKGAGAMFLLVTKTYEGVHVPAVTKRDKSGNQQSHADGTLVPQSEVQSILHEYRTVCLMGCLQKAIHTIPTESGVPPFKPIYRLSPAEDAEAEHQITEVECQRASGEVS